MTTSLTLSLSLTLVQRTNKQQRQNTDEYFISTYTSDPDCPTTLIPLNKLTLASKPKIQIPTGKSWFLHFTLWLKTRDDDENQLLSIMRDAYGYLPVLSLNGNPINLNLLDIEGNEQGTLNIISYDHFDDKISLNDKNSTINLSFTKQLLETSELIIEQMLHTYNHDDQQVFYSFTSMIGQLPLLYYPISSYIKSKNSHCTIEFLNRLLKISYLFAFDEFETTTNMLLNKSLVEKLTVLGEFATLINRCQLYQGDYIRSEIGSKLDVDSWVHLFSFPTQFLELVGYDCEDSSESSMELIYLLQTIEIPHSKEYSSLKILQDISRSYIICCTLTKLLAGDVGPVSHEGYVPHCVVILLDINYYHNIILQQQPIGIGNKYNPGLLIEGTNYTQSVWNTKQGDNEQEQEQEQGLIEEGFLQATEKSYGMLFRKILRTRLSTYDANDQQLYGPIARLLIYEPNGDANHFLTLNKSCNKNGMELNNILTYKCKPEQFIKIESIQSKFILNGIGGGNSETVETDLIELPNSMFPVIDDDDNDDDDNNQDKRIKLLSINQRQSRFIIRKIDYDQYNKDLINLLQLHYIGKQIKYIPVSITKELNIYIIDVSR